MLPHTVATTYLAGNSCYLESVVDTALTYRSVFKFKSRQTSRTDGKRSGMIECVIEKLHIQFLKKSRTVATTYLAGNSCYLESV